MTRLFLPALAAGLLAGSAVWPADWPQVRGPARDGIGAADGLARGWPESGPPTVWRRAIGAGFSSVAVRDGRLYTQAIDRERDTVFCLDAATGETIWSAPIGEAFTNSFGDGPRATPTLDGDLVLAASGDAQLAALRAADGRVVWQHDLPDRFGGAIPRFGFSGSPLVVGDLLVLEVGGGEGQPAVVALDKRTGALRWGALDGAAAYASPVVATLGGVRQILMSRRTGQELVALGLDGTVLWRHPGARTAIVMPIVVGDDRVFMSSADDNYGGVMLRVSAVEEDDWRVEEVWTNHRMRNHFNNAVVVDGAIYGFDNATLRCLDADTGTLRWARRGLGKGSLIAAGDLLFVLADDGTLVLLEATPERYAELGRVQATTGRAWTAPALAGGVLFVRDHDELVALDVAAPAEADARTAAIVARYLEARGGAERWRSTERLAMSGTYAAFSQKNPFALVRGRPDRFRIDLVMLGQEAIRARDADGLWWQQPLLGIGAPARVESGPAIRQLEREAIFGPALLDLAARGGSVTFEGEGEVDGRPTLALAVTFADGGEERWHLDPASHLEVMIESSVHDFTQGPQAMTQRAFFSDFRDVSGLVIPHHVELEFGARLEVIDVEQVEVDPALADDAFAMPAAPAAPEPGGEDGEGGR